MHRLGSWLLRYRYLVVGIWAVLLLGALPIAPGVFHSLSAGGFSSRSLEAQRANDLLEERFGFDPVALLLVYEDQSGGRGAHDPDFQLSMARAAERISALPGVARVTTPAQNRRHISPDGKAAYLEVALGETFQRDFRATVRQVEEAGQAPGLKATLTGPPVFYADIYEVTEQDLRRAELISIPFAGLALLFVFGSVAAAAVPALVGGAAVLLTLAVMALLATRAELSIFALNLTTMLGLGLGIDYSLFIVSRFRELLAENSSVEESVRGCLATAGRAVLSSGGTVFVGLLGLLLFDFTALRSMGIAGALVVGICVLAALTLLPALLAITGRRIDALAIRRLTPRVRDGAATGPRFWSRLAGGVMAHPLRTLVPVLALLLGLGAPFLRVQFGAPDASVLPAHVQSRHGFDLLREHWGDGELAPALLVFQTTDGGPVLRFEQIGALHDFVRRVQADPRVERVESLVSVDPRYSKAQYQLVYGASGGEPGQISDVYIREAASASVRAETVAVRVLSRYGQTDERSKQLVRDIRATPVPAGFSLMVGGATPGLVDYVDHLTATFPKAGLFVVLSIYLLLLLTFHSVLLPLKALLMNALSILASYGALVVIFQEGFLSGPLAFTPLGFVEASLPIIMFCVLFGLSMDYEVFLLSRVKEAYDAGLDNRASVVAGLERSGRIITSAAGIVILVSLSFVAADIVLIKALGLGTAIAVLVDATIVRALLVPATMRLLGDWNWWAPTWLRRVLPSGTPHG